MNTRRHLTFAAALMVAGCGTSPPSRLYRLPLGPASGAAPAATDSAAVQTWELAALAPLPEYLDRETLVVASGDTGLQALQGHRWAEPLRDSVPRLLRHDLAWLRGASRVWAAPVPPGVRFERSLRVELLALHADMQRRQVSLQARWWLLDPKALAAPLLGSTDLQLPLDGGGPDDIVRGHRLALWRLAERIAASAP